MVNYVLRQKNWGGRRAISGGAHGKSGIQKSNIPRQRWGSEQDGAGLFPAAKQGAQMGGQQTRPDRSCNYGREQTGVFRGADVLVARGKKKGQRAFNLGKGPAALFPVFPPIGRTGKFHGQKLPVLAAMGAERPKGHFQRKPYYLVFPSKGAENINIQNSAPRPRVAFGQQIGSDGCSSAQRRRGDPRLVVPLHLDSD